ncbi:MAG: hypothetical protein AB7F61_19160 [Desulfobulbus sp.]
MNKEMHESMKSEHKINPFFHPFFTLIPLAIFAVTPFLVTPPPPPWSLGGLLEKHFSSAVRHYDPLMDQALAKDIVEGAASCVDLGFFCGVALTAIVFELFRSFLSILRCLKTYRQPGNACNS